jgi:hypothetical protein
MISGFRRDVYDNCAPLVYDAANGGNSLLTFRTTLADGIEFPKTSVRNYHKSQRYSSEQHSSQMLIQTNNIHKTARQAKIGV